MAPSHVVIHPLPAAGHVIASAALAQKLASSGFFFVSFACAHHRLFDPRAGNKLAAQLLLHSNIRVIDLEDNLPSLQYSQIDNGVASVASLKIIVPRTREPFERIMVELMASASPPVCIISDFLTYTSELAEKFEIPLYVFFPMAARELAFQLYVPHFQSQGLAPLRLRKSENEDELSLADSELIIVPGLPPWKFRECNNFMLETSLPDFQQGFFHFCNEVHKARGILVNTFDELEAEAMDALRTPIINPNRIPIYSIGPLISSILPINVSHASDDVLQYSSMSQSDNSEYYLQWLSSQPSSSVIYISFGSIFIPSLDQISELACGLEATKTSFIWVVRPPRSTTGEISKAGFEVAKVLPDGFQARTADRGLVVSSWVPQQRILAHPSTAGFFTHCGWNSTMESIYNGVPTIALPEFYDQMTNCKILVEQLGMGVEARRGAKGIVCREEVERVVGLLTDGEKGARMRENARQWSEVTKRAFSSAHGSSSSTSSKSLVSFLRDMSTLHQANGKDYEQLCEWKKNTTTL